MKFTFTGNWKNFERVIAAFHSAEMAGATINLNEEINGREFDVTIRFQVGFYEYLTLIECKRYSKPVSVEKVEAFVTKSRDANANKALMFSSSGYQSSAIKVAEKYSIDLYTVFEEIRIPEDIQAGGSTEALNVFDVRIVINSKEYSLPQENGRMEYLMRQSFLSDGVGRMTLEDFMQNKLPELNDPSRENEKTKFFPMPGFKLTAPDLYKEKPIDGIKVHYKLMDLVNLKQDTPPFDHHLFEKMHTFYCMRNEITGKNESIMAISVHLGFDTRIEAGKYYSNPQIGNRYYVESIENNKAVIYLIESYARGHLIQAVFVQDVMYQSQFVVINDKDEIERLSKLYLKMKERKR